MVSDRVQTLSLFHPDCLSAIYLAAQSAVSNSQAITSAEYNFVKTLAQIVDMLGFQLTVTWGKEPSVKEPDNFKVNS